MSSREGSIYGTVIELSFSFLSDDVTGGWESAKDVFAL